MNSRLFSGVQPSGRLHLGNYFGAIKQWIALQEEFDALFCVVDLHAITVPQDPKDLRRKTFEIAKTYLALGIDPERAHIFIQSHVAEHTELAWILGTIAKIGELEKMTQFKDKAAEREMSGVGLFTYPVLMAADILLYDTDTVPVGEDQTQHLELARTLARRFNKRFGETFRIPKTHMIEASARIMGLDNPEKKMSKSAASEYNFIALDDDPELAKKKIMKAVTDSGSDIAYTDEKPALRNLLAIFALLEDTSPEDIAGRYAGKGYAEFKRDLAEAVSVFLEDFQSRYSAISDDDVRDILKRGAKYASGIARENMQDIRNRVGLLGS